ncbi:MAG: hypothetical protein JRE64_02845 [Deltaproteobacteria bacterium]|nr:hypothetical protein [Deltaproteobacteria bacterium]
MGDKQKKSGESNFVSQNSMDSQRVMGKKKKGFSPRNLKYMRAFASAWSDREIVQEVLARITWYHNMALLEKLNDSQTRIWYAPKVAEHGWSRNILIFQIESGLYERQVKAVNNFFVSMPSEESDMAVQVFKDPDAFDFHETADPRREAELEQKLIDHVQQVKPLHQQVVLILQESNTVASLRDALLPKLISGELRVPAVALEELVAQASVPVAEKLVEGAV